jgi:hypothetical protein
MACAVAQPVPPAEIELTVPPPVIRTIPVTDDISIGLSQQLDGWLVTSEAPDYLVEEFAHHIEHELAEKGQTRTHEEVVAVVHKRLASNELYIYKESSRAWIAIDFSALQEGEKVPGRQAVYNSARYAADSLSGEEGVSDVQHTVSSVSVYGADTAFRLDAAFASHGEPRKFSGIIGFANPYWFYVYYTDELNDPADFSDIDKLLDSLTLSRF